MPSQIDHTTLHRTAKYFLDNGRADSPEEAVGVLQQFGLTIRVGPEIAHSADHQTALLTLVNVASRTLLGGIHVAAFRDAPSRTRLAPNVGMHHAVQQLGATIVDRPEPNWPEALIGTASPYASAPRGWQLTWEGWRAGVVPARENWRLSETQAIPLAPALAAAVCAAEVFAFHAGDHPMAGRRASGLSLWRLGVPWQTADPGEPTLSYLPSRLWLVGLGNLGQAFAWLFGTLPYPSTAWPNLVLQDYDRISLANQSTSLLTQAHDVGRKKTRVVAEWLESRGIETTLEERSFGPHVRRGEDDPAVAFCGVDNASARRSLDQAGFDLVVETGLGAGPQGFRGIHLHTLPATRTAAEIWPLQADTAPRIEHMPAYKKLRQDGMDECGVAQLASRSVAVPFVGLGAAALAISEMLRRLHGGPASEVTSVSMESLDDVEQVSMAAPVWTGGHIACVY